MSDNPIDNFDLGTDEADHIITDPADDVVDLDAEQADDALSATEGIEPTEPDDDDAEPEPGEQRRPGVRQRLEDAEEAVEHLTGLLEHHRQDVFNRLATDHGCNPWLLRSAGELSVDDHLTSDGLVDVESLTAAIEQTRQKLGLPAPGRRPAPNPLAGHGGDSEQAPGFGQILKDFVTRPR